MNQVNKRMAALKLTSNKQTSQQTAAKQRRRRPRQPPHTRNVRVDSKNFSKRGRAQLGYQRSVLGRLARLLVMPSEGKPMRFPVQSQGVQPTAVWALQGDTIIDFTNIASPKQVLLLTHSPIAPVWGWSSGSQLRSYSWSANLGPTGMMSDPYFSGFNDTNTVPCYPAVLGNTSYTYGYIPEGCAFSITVQGCGSTTGTAEISALLTKEDPSEPSVAKYTVTISQGTGTATVAATTAAGWFSVQNIALTGGATAGVGFAVNLIIPANQTGIWPLMLLPGLNGFGAVFDKARQNSASLLCMNTTAPLYKNGTVRGGRLSWTKTNIFTSSSVSTAITGLAKPLRFVAPAQTGAYTYAIPDEASLAFSDYSPPGISTIAPFVFDLNDFSHVNAISFLVGTAADKPFTLELRLDVHIEAITDLPQYPLDVSLLPISDFMLALAASSKIPPFTENPNHTALVGVVRRILKALAPVVLPYAHKGVDAMAAAIEAW